MSDEDLYYASLALGLTITVGIILLAVGMVLLALAINSLISARRRRQQVRQQLAQSGWLVPMGSRGFRRATVADLAAHETKEQS